MNDQWVSVWSGMMEMFWIIVPIVFVVFVISMLIHHSRDDDEPRTDTFQPRGSLGGFPFFDWILRVIKYYIGYELMLIFMGAFFLGVLSLINRVMLIVLIFYLVAIVLLLLKRMELIM